MIHPNSRVTWIDLTWGNDHGTTTISELASRYAAYKVITPDGRGRVDLLNHKSVYIQYMHGYTKLISILEGPIDSEWISIKNANNFIVTKRTFVPVYDTSVPSFRGFHGEVKHPYDMKEIETVISKYNFVIVAELTLDMFIKNSDNPTY